MNVLTKLIAMLLVLSVLAIPAYISSYFGFLIGWLSFSLSMIILGIACKD